MDQETSCPIFVSHHNTFIDINDVDSSKTNNDNEERSGTCLAV